MSEAVLIPICIGLVVLQSVLCLKSSSRILRWALPVACVLAALVCFVIGFTAQDPWYTFAYWVWAVFFLFFLVACGIGALTAFLIRQARRSMDASQNRLSRK